MWLALLRFVRPRKRHPDVWKKLLVEHEILYAIKSVTKLSSNLWPYLLITKSSLIDKRCHLKITRDEYLALKALKNKYR